MKLLVLRVCNIALYLITCVLAGTGLLLELRLEEHGDRILGMSSDDWGEIHLVIALIFVALSIGHVLLNWNWVVGLFRGKKRRAMVVTGLVGLALAAGILLVPASSPRGQRGDHGEQRQAQEDH